MLSTDLNWGPGTCRRC